MTTMPETNKSIFDLDESVFGKLLCPYHLIVPLTSRRADSMIDTLSDSLTISALTPVKAKMKPYVEFGGKAWIPPNFDIKSPDSDWLKPKISRTSTKLSLTQSETDVVKSHNFNFPKANPRRIKSEQFKIKIKNKNKMNKNQKRYRTQSDNSEMNMKSQNNSK
eukprot:432488_1